MKDSTTSKFKHRPEDSPPQEVGVGDYTRAATEGRHDRGVCSSGLGGVVIFVALVAILLERMVAVASDLHLWGDGAWFLVRIASSRTYYFWITDWRTEFFRSRVFTNLAVQTPLVLATHLRIHSLHALSLIFGITLYSHALISLYLCYRYAPRRRYMLFPLLSFVAGTMSAESYIVTDSHFLVSLYWPVLFILLFRDELKNGTLLLLFGLSFPMLLSYESMMFFGVILAGVCFWRRHQLPRNTAILTVLAAWYLLGVALAVAAFLRPFDPSNKSGFLRGLYIVIFLTNDLAAKVALIVLFCCVVLLIAGTRFPRLQTAAATVGLASIFYLCWQVLTGHAPTSLNEQISARVFNLLVPLIVTALLFWVLRYPFQPGRRALGLTAVLVGALGMGQAYWTLACVGQWQGMLATLRTELFLHDGPIAFSGSVLSRPQLGPLHLRDLHATWPLLPLSIYESERGQVKSVVVPPQGAFMPFDPLSPDTFPDLSRYRVSYALYRDALQPKPDEGLSKPTSDE